MERVMSKSQLINQVINRYIEIMPRPTFYVILGYKTAKTKVVSSSLMYRVKLKFNTYPDQSMYFVIRGYHRVTGNMVTAVKYSSQPEIHIPINLKNIIITVDKDVMSSIYLQNSKIEIVDDETSKCDTIKRISTLKITMNEENFMKLYNGIRNNKCLKYIETITIPCFKKPITNQVLVYE